MRTLLSVALALLVLPLAACDGAGADGTALRYTLTLRQDDAVVATGEIRFDAAPRAGTETTGTFTLQQSGGGPLPPLAVTSGTFRASFESDGDLLVQINPAGTTDTGIQLSGTYSAASYTGSWFEVTIAGPELRGEFTATAVAD
jgi:hypothetical protein